MMKRILCALLALFMLFAAGCGEVAENSSVTESGSEAPAPQKSDMQLLYCLADSFDPYSAETAVNRELCGLIYDPLVSLDDSFESVYALAQSVENDGKKCTVTLKDARFTDGSAVTASDVVYSYERARASATSAYSKQLYAVASVAASSTKTVVFSLNRVDMLFEKMLDFPILKAGSDKITDADGVVQPPIGCGRYKLNPEKDALIRNDEYYATRGNVAEIRLINAPDKESVSHYVEIGATDIYFTDVSDGKIVRMSGKKIDINLNDLVYIGINESNDALRNVNMRYAISSAIDRDAICKTAYYNNAKAASGFFHPDFKPTSSLQNLKNTNDLKIAIENLEKIGYNRLDSNGYRINSAGKYPSFTLLVNSENAARVAAAELIAQQLKAAGIALKVIKQPYAQYMASLQGGAFQMYIGECRITSNMDFSGLVVPGGSVSYGRTPVNKETDVKEPTENADNAEQIAVPATAAEIVAGFYEGRYTLNDVASVLLTELPAIPVCYKKGLLFYDPAAVDLTQASAKDIYYSDETGKRVGS